VKILNSSLLLLIFSLDLGENLSLNVEFHAESEYQLFIACQKKLVAQKNDDEKDFDP
jgi:hypothetical protein